MAASSSSQQLSPAQEEPAVVDDKNNSGNAWKAFLIFGTVVAVVIVGTTIHRWSNFASILSQQQQQQRQQQQSTSSGPNIAIALVLVIIAITVIRSTGLVSNNGPVYHTSSGRAYTRPATATNTATTTSSSSSSLGLRILAALVVSLLSVWMLKASNGQFFVGRGGSVNQRFGNSGWSSSVL